MVMLSTGLPSPMAVALSVMDRPWAWGEADCCTAACDVFGLLHGIDPMASLRGRYRSQMGAARIIAKAGGFVAMAEGLAQAARLGPSFGEPGDIGVAKMTDGHALVICVAPGQWAGKTVTGMTTVQDVVRCWRA